MIINQTNESMNVNYQYTFIFNLKNIRLKMA